MFRIGIIELAISCSVVFLVVVIPVLVARHQARIEKRLEKIENQLRKKKEL